MMKNGELEKSDTERPITTGTPSGRKVFLITGCPRSGTQYTGHCLQRLGYAVPTERVDWEWSHGSVGWTHLPIASMFEPVAQQVRDPLKVISSMHTITSGSFSFMHSKIGAPDKLGDLYNAMWCYTKWVRWAESIATLTYRVEDLDRIFPDVFGFLGLPVPERLPGSVPLNQNTRKDSDLYKTVTWKDLRKEDTKLAAEIGLIAKSYQYETED